MGRGGSKAVKTKYKLNFTMSPFCNLLGHIAETFLGHSFNLLRDTFMEQHKISGSVLAASFINLLSWN